MSNWTVVVPSADRENLRCFLKSYADTGHQDPEQNVVAVVGNEFDDAGLLARFVRRQGRRFNWAAAINLGVCMAPLDNDVLIVGDDVELLTLRAIERLVELAEITSGRFFVHAAVHGNRFNHPELQPRGMPDIVTYPPPCPLPLICALLPAQLRAAVGSFDESFAGYGFEDHDYVRRAEAEGFGYMVAHGVAIEHYYDRSTYLKRQDYQELAQQNRDRFTEKWGVQPLR